MTWEFVEANPFSDSSGNFLGQVGYLAKVLDRSPATQPASVRQLDATKAMSNGLFCISTDPPYYDNVPYADLSDYFYVWLRQGLQSIYPDLFSTPLSPKSTELVADSIRHAGRQKAKEFFELGLGQAFERMKETHDARYPITLLYAFRQSESTAGSGSAEVDMHTASTGWETMLQALLDVGFVITGTWPIRTEQPGGLREIGRNSLASSIVLVCRARSDEAPLATRRELVIALKNDLPRALKKLQDGNVAPVDLAQAAVGPGMAVFSRYSRIIEADGSPMRVRTALGLINQLLDEVLAEQESEFDSATRWAIAWFDQFGMSEGLYGIAETLSKAKNTAVAGLVSDGFLEAKAGKVRLLSRGELALDWDPTTDTRLTVWEVTQRLVRALDVHGEAGAARILRTVGSLGGIARDLAYRLYTTCERKRWASEALGYNALVVAWPEIQQLAAQGRIEQDQGDLFS